MQLCNTQLKADWNRKVDVLLSIDALDGTKSGKPAMPARSTSVRSQKEVHAIS